MDTKLADIRFKTLIKQMKTQLYPSAETNFHYKNLQQIIGWEASEQDWFERQQLKQIEQLIHYAIKQSPWYARVLSDSYYNPEQALTEEIWQALPILKRSDVVAHFEQIKTKVSPKSHGKVSYLQTSGSTGKPVQGFSTEYNQFFFQLNVLQEHIWHQRDFSKRFAAIRPDKISLEQRMKQADSWGSPVNYLFQSNRAGIMHSSVPVDEQWQWLMKFKPAYLLTLPSNLNALLHLSIQNNQMIPGLQEVRTYGETVSHELRERIQSHWNIPLIDMYTSTEAGYFAIQCPKHDHYHIVSDTTRVEILDDNNRPCQPGQIGRVVITPLHNFAFPLIRYEIDDYAELGESCDCGCQFPVIKKIMGRSRNMLLTPDGKSWWPSFPAESWSHIAPARQIQITQDKIDHLMVTLVLDEAMDSSQETEFIEALHTSLNYPFHIDFCYKSHIPRKKNGKFEDFISAVEP